MTRRTRPNKAELALAAAEYLARGWSIIPIKHRSQKGKEPACKSWKEWQEQRADDDQVHAWMEKVELDGWGVVCGPVSGGLTIRDFDDPKAYDLWRQAFPQLAKTLPTLRTGKGYHVYFLSTFTGIRHIGDGELRGGGYCLAPPSVHPSGKRYEWIVPLPAGELRRLDPVQAGLAPVGTERTETTERPEEDRVTEGNIKCVGHASPTVACSSIAGGDLDEQIEAAILATMPKGTGERNQAIFEFARFLKSIPALADASPRELRVFVERWHARALTVIGTKVFEDTWGDFLYGWPRVKFPRGVNPVTSVFQAAESKPFPPEAENYEAPESKRLVRFCREFQRAVGGDPFFLSCRTAAKLFEMDHRTAARRLKAMCGDELLELAETGGMRANRYYYRGDLNDNA